MVDCRIGLSLAFARYGVVFMLVSSGSSVTHCSAVLMLSAWAGCSICHPRREAKLVRLK